MLNAVGLQNPGIEHVLAHELPELKRIYNKKIIANIGGFSVDEYVECARLADKRGQRGDDRAEHKLSQRPRRRDGLRHHGGKPPAR